MLLKLFNAYVLYPAAEKKLKRNIRTKLKTLEQEHKLSGVEREKIQKERIYEILIHAKKHVPYYRDLFQELKFDPANVRRNLSELNDLPFLTKEIIREQGTRMLDERYNEATLHVRKTGGSTGTSTLIYYDQEALDWTAAVNLFAQGFTGRNHIDTEIHLSTAFKEVQPLRSRLTEALKCMAMNRQNIYTSALDDSQLALLANQIKESRAYLLQGHPSTVYALALYAIKTGKQGKYFTAFESTGESIDQKKIQTIESALGCKVYNRYGTAEFGVTAHSREVPHELEIIDSIVHHETVSLGNGLEEIVGTTLTNFAMPLIRYRSGDIASLHEENGRKFISKIQGRVHDLIFIHGKPYPTHYLQDVLDRLGGVDEFQIVEKTNGKKWLNLVPNERSHIETIQNNLQQYLDDSFIIRFIKMDELVFSGWRDKFRYVVKES